MLCDYGCGQEAKYQMTSGRWCCSKFPCQCIIIRKKNSKKNIGRVTSNETRKKLSSKLKGKKRTLEQRKKSSETRIGKNLGSNNPFFGRKHSNESIKKIRAANYRSFQNPNSIFNSKEYKEKQKESIKKFRQTLEGRKLCKKAANVRWADIKQHENQSKKISEKFKDPTFIESFRYSIEYKPNKKEEILLNLLNKILPNQYRYTGNRTFWVHKKNPDFKKNGKKKVIEHLGDYYHSEEFTGKSKKEHEIDLIEHYKKYGFFVLIIWENELNDLEKVRDKILNFNMAGDW